MLKRFLILKVLLILTGEVIRRSTNGYVFTLFGGAINWMSKRQSSVALSSTKIEYMAATHGCKEAIWIKRLLADVGFVQKSMLMNCDSQSAIHLAKNPAYHARSKYIDVQYHFVIEMVEANQVILQECDTSKNVADSLTKYIEVFLV